MDLSSLPGSGTNSSTLSWSRPDKQNDDPTYLLLYVDDMLIAAKNKTHVHKLKVQLKKEFDMKDLGESKKILGMEIT